MNEHTYSPGKPEGKGLHQKP